MARRDHEQVADYLDSNREAWEALALATPSDAADIIEQLDEEDAAQLLSELPPSDAAEILEEISPELAAELIEKYPLADLAAAKELPVEGAIHAAYLRALSRPPTEEEVARARQHIDEATSPAEGLRDLVWALVNTKEFILNH